MWITWCLVFVAFIAVASPASNILEVLSNIENVLTDITGRQPDKEILKVVDDYVTNLGNDGLTDVWKATDNQEKFKGMIRPLVYTLIGYINKPCMKSAMIFQCMGLIDYMIEEVLVHDMEGTLRGSIIHLQQADLTPLEDCRVKQLPKMMFGQAIAVSRKLEALAKRKFSSRLFLKTLDNNLKTNEAAMSSGELLKKVAHGIITIMDPKLSGICKAKEADVLNILQEFHIPTLDELKAIIGNEEPLLVNAAGKIDPGSADVLATTVENRFVLGRQLVDDLKKAVDSPKIEDLVTFEAEIMTECLTGLLLGNLSDTSTEYPVVGFGR